jgi:membrane-associated protease RseP (regulator of RpoE activity)
MGAFKEFLKQYFIRLNTGMRSPAREANVISEAAPKKENPAVNVFLFIATFISTTFVGGTSVDSIVDFFISGLPYSITLMMILLTHEFGHFFAARRFGVKSTLPYFIPFPSLIGTMGAIIKTKSPIPHRRALFYIGVMGPLPGFIISLVAFTIGIALSEIKPLPTGAEGGGFILGDSLLVSFVVKLIHGTIPAGKDVFLSQYAKAGWFGFLITNLNLMPIGQLDGSHVVYSLIGKKQLFVGWGALAGLVILSFMWPGWTVWIVMTLLILMVAHPEVQEGVKLTVPERIIGWLCLAIFILTFVPVPIDFI